MAVAKNTSTVQTLQAPKKVVEMRGVAKKATARKTGAKPTTAGKGLKVSSGGDALDVLRLFIKTYENL